MHAIAFGKRLLGRVDTVPGRYHVATLCFHFCYLPLVPLGTYLVLTQSMSGLDTTFDGVRLPFSVKSWLIAWSRTLLWFPFLMAVMMTVLTFFPAPGDRVGPGQKPVMLTVLGVLAALLFGPYVIPGLGRATRARAAELAAFAARQPVSSTVRAVHW